jgi:hypothetical protein
MAGKKGLHIRTSDPHTPASRAAFATSEPHAGRAVSKPAPAASGTIKPHASVFATIDPHAPFAAPPKAVTGKSR